MTVTIIGGLTLIKADLLRAYALQTSGSRGKRIAELLRSPGMYAVIIYRFAHWERSQPLLLKILLKPLKMYLEHRTRAKWGIQIESGATIGEGFVIHHYGGIFITNLSVIGKNFTIQHDVTVGTAGTGDRYGGPAIGDNVWIHPGAKVNGKIRVGNNVHIGPNAVVAKNIPDDALVHTAQIQIVKFPSLYRGAKSVDS